MPLRIWKAIKKSPLIVAAGIIIGLTINWTITDFNTSFGELQDAREQFVEITNTGMPVIKAYRLVDSAIWDNHLWIRMEAKKTTRSCGTPIDFSISYVDGETNYTTKIDELAFLDGESKEVRPVKILEISDEWQELAWWRILPVFDNTSFYITVQHKCPINFVLDSMDTSTTNQTSQATEIITYTYGPFKLENTPIKNPIDN